MFLPTWKYSVLFNTFGESTYPPSFLIRYSSLLDSTKFWEVAGAARRIWETPTLRVILEIVCTAGSVGIHMIHQMFVLTAQEKREARVSVLAAKKFRGKWNKKPTLAKGEPLPAVFMRPLLAMHSKSGTHFRHCVQCFYSNCTPPLRNNHNPTFLLICLRKCVNV